VNLSFIIPVYNEEKNIVNVIKNILSHFNGAEIIIVDGGSTDSTVKVLEQFKDNIKLVKMRYNYMYGYLQTLKEGMKHASNDYLFCIDGDGQYRPKMLPKLSKDIIISGVKSNRLDDNFRTTISKLSNFFAKVLFKTNYKDMNCGYKVFHKNAIPIFNKVKYLPLSPWGEFLIRCHYSGFKIKIIDIPHYKRKYGKSRLMRNMIHVSITNGIGGIKLALELFRGK